MRDARKYLIAALLPLAVLLFLPAYPRAIVVFGEKCALTASASASTDSFKGESIALTLDISSLPVSMFDGGAEKGAAYYVSLAETGGGACSASGAHRTPPDGIYLKGTAIRVSETVRMDYGRRLERFYVEEGTAKAAAGGKLLVGISVLKGEAVITSVQSAK